MKLLTVQITKILGWKSREVREETKREITLASEAAEDKRKWTKKPIWVFWALQTKAEATDSCAEKKGMLPSRWGV